MALAFLLVNFGFPKGMVDVWQCGVGRNQQGMWSKDMFFYLVVCVGFALLSVAYHYRNRSKPDMGATMTAAFILGFWAVALSYIFLDDLLCGIAAVVGYFLGEMIHRFITWRWIGASA